MATLGNEWEIVECEIVFDKDGIQLNTTYRPEQPSPPGQPNLVEALASISGGTRPQWPLADGALDPFQPQKIRIRKDCVTHLIFYSRSVKWKFDPPGLTLKSPPLPPDIGALANPNITHSGHTVWTTFDPNHPDETTQIHYNLRLITSVSNMGDFSGHAIIIIDPIIETSRG